MQISVNLQSGRFEKKSPNLQWGEDFYIQNSVNLQSGRFEKKSPNPGGFLHADFSKSAGVADLRKISKLGGISACRFQ